MAINNSKIYKICFKNVKYLRLLIYKLPTTKQQK